MGTVFKRDNTPVYMAGCNFRRCYRFQVEQRKAKKWCHERSLQINRQQNTEPDGIEFDHYRCQHRNMNESYLDKIEKKPITKIKIS